MTPEQQRKADHLALVAARIFAPLWQASEPRRNTAEELIAESLDLAAALQKAAEERVAHE